jgi:hypothetical protein
MAKQRKLWVVGVLLLACGAAVASNMGFKFVPNITQSGPAKQYTVSFPLNNNYTNAASVLGDIPGGCNATGVIRIAPSVGGSTRQGWLAPGTGTNFSISKGEGYLVETTANCTTWVIVGSHDPAYVYNFASGLQTLASIPYHTTATAAADLLSSVGPNASGVIRIAPSVGGATRQGWLAPGTGTNFPVTIGEAYLVEVSAATAWTPAHY